MKHIILVSFLIIGIYSKIYSNQLSISLYCKISDYKESKIKTIYLIRKEKISQEEKTITFVNIDTSKEFNIIKFKPESTLLYLRYDNIDIPLFFETNGVAYISFSHNNIFKSIKFSGYNAAINNYLIAKQIKLDSLLPNDIKSLYSLSPENFYAFNNNVKLELDKIYDRFILNEKKDDLFWLYQKYDNFSIWAIKMMLYPSYHNHFTKEKINLASNYYSFLDQIPLTKNPALLSQKYIQLLSEYFNFKLKQNSKRLNLTIKEEQIEELQKRYDLIMSTFKGDDVKEFLITQLLITYLNLGFEDIFEKKILSVKSKFKSNKYLHFAINKQRSLKAIGYGRDAPDFTFTDINGKENKISSFFGNFIFINVWTLGCHPSLDELPFLNNIQDQFQKNDKLIFLNLYQENDKENWIYYLNTNNIKGINAIASESNSKFNEKYFIDSTPRYIIIDKNGKIADAYAPRPSSNELLPLLKELIAK